MTNNMTLQAMCNARCYRCSLLEIKTTCDIYEVEHPRVLWMHLLGVHRQVNHFYTGYTSSILYIHLINIQQSQQQNRTEQRVNRTLSSNILNIVSR